MKGLLIVVSGPSGTGKGTVLAKWREIRKLQYSISATTRNKREGEVDGREYYFKTRAEFEAMIKNGELLEWAETYGNYYGTPSSSIEATLAKGEDVLLEIDTVGAAIIMEKMTDAVFIFLAPPSLAELEKRINTRGTEDKESLAKRLNLASAEIANARKYKYIVVNADVSTAVNDLEAILRAEKKLVARNEEIIRTLEAE